MTVTTSDRVSVFRIHRGHSDCYSDMVFRIHTLHSDCCSDGVSVSIIHAGDSDCYSDGRFQDRLGSHAIRRPLREDRLGGPVVKVSASRVEGPGFESRLRREFSGSSHTSDFKIGTPVAYPARRLAL